MFEDRNKLIHYLDLFIDWFIILNLVAITALVCTQVALRYVFNAPLMGIEELTYFPTVWLYLGGTIKASAEKSQLVARVLELFVKTQKNVCLIRSIAAAISTGVLMWLTYWGFDLLKYTLRLQKQTDILFLPWSMMEGFVFVSFAFMLFYTIIELSEQLTAYKNTERNTDKIPEEVTE